jgi:hypothetical protein
MVMAASTRPMRYQRIAPERRKALQAQPNGFKWVLFFMLQVSLILLLLEAQRAAHRPVPLLIRAGHTSDLGCTCGECAYCKSDAERECDYGR